MRIESLSESTRLSCLTDRVVQQLFATLLLIGAPSAGLTNLREGSLPPVQTVFSSVAPTPPKQQALAECMSSVEGFILVSLKYYSGYPLTFKNLRNDFPKQLSKPFGLVTASYGSRGDDATAAIGIRPLGDRITAYVAGA